jgi:hypothetical protein
MKNSEKDELRRECKRLAITGYDKKKAIEILTKQGYCKSTIRKYWEVFGNTQSS